MVLAFVTMSTIQIVWLRTSVQMREQLFDDNVYHSLNQVSEMLTKTSTGMLQIDLEALLLPMKTPMALAIQVPLAQASTMQK